MNRLAVAAIAALMAVSGLIGSAVTSATRGHPKIQHAVFAVENEATKLLRHGFAATGRCGIERWDEKTLALSDPASESLLGQAATRTSIPALRSLPGPAQNGQRTRGAEQTVWKLAGTWLTAYKLELDSDIHLKLESAIDGTTMIAEIPDPGCAANPDAKARFAAARTAFVTQVGQPVGYYTSTRIRVNISGPGFFDFNHGQNGVAPNGIELHPLLAFKRWR